MDTNPQQPDKELSVAKAAELLSVSRFTIYRYIHEGLVSYRNVAVPGSKRPTYRLLEREIEELLANRLKNNWQPPKHKYRRSNDVRTMPSYGHIRLHKSN